MRHSFLIIFLAFTINISYAEPQDPDIEKDILNPDQEPFFNYNFGISPFLGLIGIEYQSGKNAVGFGLPGHLSYRYFFHPYRDSKFIGAYVGRYSTENADDTVDGVFFKEQESEYFGVGLGKRWQWPSGWNFTLSVAMERYENNYSNPGSSIKGKEDGYLLFPGINGGYKF